LGQDSLQVLPPYRLYSYSRQWENSILYYSFNVKAGLEVFVVWKTLPVMGLLLVLGCVEVGIDDSPKDLGQTSDVEPGDDASTFDGQTVDDSTLEGDAADGVVNVDSSPATDVGVEADTRPVPDTQVGPRPDATIPPTDDAEIVSASLPLEMNCGSLFEAEVTVRNTGTEVWSRDAGYKLGALDDSDPLYNVDTRVWLPPEITVEPGQNYTFSFQLTAPAEAGAYVTDWRMVKEGVFWFGETASQAVIVNCAEEPNPEEPAPLPDESDRVDELAAERPDLLMQSCLRDGGNNEFLFELLRRLRVGDERWGLNWKRGNVGDLSQDIVNYYWGPGDPQEGSTDVYPIDVIVGHCPEDGDPPSTAGWLDQTQATAEAGAIARWTIMPLPR
jgi:hypothetical protein